MRRLVDEIRGWAEDEVTVVLDSGPEDLTGTVGHVTVIRARRRGRDAADDEIAALAARRRPRRHLRRDAGGSGARARRDGRRRGHVPASARFLAVSDEGLRAAVEKMREEGVADAAINAFEHYYRQLEAGETGLDARGLDRAGHRPPPPRRAAVRSRRRARSAEQGDRAAAQRRPGHEHGADGREVAAGGQGRAELPGHHRPPGAGAARGARRGAAARADGLVLHPRGLAGGARRARGPRRRAPARLHPEQGAQAPGRGPHARRVAGQPVARVVPARPRRPLHGARDLGDARGPARARVRVRVRRQLRQPRRGARAAHPRLAARERDPVPDGGHRAHGGRPQGRPPGQPTHGRPARPARDGADAGRGPQGAAGPGQAPRTRTRTTCGSACAPWTRRCASATACSACR